MRWRGQAWTARDVLIALFTAHGQATSTGATPESRHEPEERRVFERVSGRELKEHVPPELRRRRPALRLDLETLVQEVVRHLGQPHVLRQRRHSSFHPELIVHDPQTFGSAQHAKENSSSG